MNQNFDTSPLFFLRTEEALRRMTQDLLSDLELFTSLL